MTKRLSNEEKKQRKADRRKSKQQKAPSKTVKTITQPNPPEKEAQPVNLCDDCAYEYGECEGKPKFASDQDGTLTGAEADCVVECPTFVNVAEMPTADQASNEAVAEYPGVILVCSGGCGKTTEGMTHETISGEFKYREEDEGSTDWTCQDCLGKAAVEEKSEGHRRECGFEHLRAFPGCFSECDKDKCDGVPADAAHGGDDKGAAETKEEPVQPANHLTERPDPKRFLVEEDFGKCPSCDRPLKRTAFNRYHDAIRCTNLRCRAYRGLIKTVSTGIK